MNKNLISFALLALLVFSMFVSVADAASKPSHKSGARKIPSKQSSSKEEEQGDAAEDSDGNSAEGEAEQPEEEQPRDLSARTPALCCFRSGGSYAGGSCYRSTVNTGSGRQARNRLLLASRACASAGSQAALPAKCERITLDTSPAGCPSPSERRQPKTQRRHHKEFLSERQLSPINFVFLKLQQALWFRTLLPPSQSNRDPRPRTL